ncbi:MAG: AbfB domain-containing protein [Kutzneria sp.]|nr:AbfB domain-containing protein [Kutzneria sp.]
MNAHRRINSAPHRSATARGALRSPGLLRVAGFVTALVTGGALALVAPPAYGAAQRAVTPPLTTPWTNQVGPNNALPEYPRPELTRVDWLNLNGDWQWAPAAAGDAPPVGQPLGRTILVPYPVESALSGVGEHHDRMWYRRTVAIPASWSGRRVQMNFGAVDWQADVWVNGTHVGTHTGGYTRFSFDITDQLRAGENELVVGVYDPTDAGGQPIGKQRLSPNRIFYTASTGIWQTVWLEPTVPAHITRLDMTPDVADSKLNVVVQAADGAGATATVGVLSGGLVVGSATGAPGSTLSVPVPAPHLWSPSDPFLYDVHVTLASGNAVDSVGSYVGMRSIGLTTVNGTLRPVLNGQFVFQLGTLDQGFWPDGIYTAPTDDALKFDIQAYKDLGFNTIRKHVKVEPDRWYYWADKLGVLVWQDMPSMVHDRAPTPEAKTNFEAELHEMIDQHRSVTSIVQWVPINEGWGEYDPAHIIAEVKNWDPSRLVDDNSGSNCCGFDGGNGDLIDDHIYVGPGDPHRPANGRAAVLGEFGGLGLRVGGHEWSPGNGFGYEMQADAPTLTNRYLGLLAQVQSLINRNGLSAAIYTELTDVENEVNGLYTYDRRVLKPNAARIRAANQAVIAGTPVYGRTGLPTNTWQSIEVTTPGYTDRYIRHADSLGYTEHVDAGSAALLKADATWRFVPGLADKQCYSIESKNYPGEYLRHQDSRVRRDPDNGTDLMHQDATWCAVPGLSGTNVSFESYNYPGKFLRHVDSQLWLADNSGSTTYSNPAWYGQDVTWHIVAPWTP